MNPFTLFSRIYPRPAPRPGGDTPQVTRPVILDCKLIEPEVTQSRIIYVIEGIDEETFDWVTIFCLGFAASAMLIVLALVLAWFWRS